MFGSVAFTSSAAVAGQSRRVRQALGEILAQHQDAAHLAGGQRGLGVVHAGGALHREIGRRIDRLQQPAHDFVRRVGHQRDRHVVGVERNAEAVHQQQHQRHQEGDQDGGGIAQDVLDLLAQQAAQPHGRWRSCAAVAGALRRVAPGR